MAKKKKMIFVNQYGEKHMRYVFPLRAENKAILDSLSLMAAMAPLANINSYLQQL